MKLPVDARTQTVPARTKPQAISNSGIFASIVASVVITVVLLGVDTSRELSGILVLLLTISLLLAGVPIGIGMIGASLLGLWVLSGPGVATSTLQELVYGSTASWSLSVIPLFILMGIILGKSGLTTSAFNAARQWLGNLPGGLAIATNFSGAGLAAASGSSLGISYALGRIAIPEMLRSGYRPSLATATVAVAGTLGQLIPPSILLVVYASVAQTSIGPQLLAAIIPGILLACAYAIMIFIRSLLKPDLAPRTSDSDVTWSTRFRSLTGVVPIAIVVLVVIGGLVSGLFTPTEAGSFGAFAALVFGLTAAYRRTKSLPETVRVFRDSVMQTAVASAAIFLMLIGVYLLTRVLTVSRITAVFTDWLLSVDLTPVQFLLILVVIYLVMGMFLEPLAMILLTVPVLAGPLDAMGIDMLWFGIFLVILCEVAQVSPPLGLLSFVIHKIAREPEVNLGHDISLIEVFRGVLWFVAVSIIILLLIIIVPDIVTWLPGVT